MLRQEERDRAKGLARDLLSEIELKKSFRFMPIAEEGNGENEEKPTQTNKSF